jgi:hypothetical protein
MKYVLVALCSLEIADAAVTNWAVTNRLAQEWNPLLGSLAGDWQFLLLKVVGAIVCALALWTTYRRFPRIALMGANCVVIFYGIVLTWNLHVLSQF